MKLTGTDRQTGGQDQKLSQADAMTKNQDSSILLFRTKVMLYFCLGTEYNMNKGTLFS